MATEDFLIRKGDGAAAQLFAPREGDTLVSPYTPAENEIVKPATDVTVTLDGKSVLYLAGEPCGFRKGVTYILSASTDVHRM